MRELAAAPSDAELLLALLRIEQVIVFAYEHALAAAVLPASAQAILGTFLEHERAHVHKLSTYVSPHRGAVPGAPKDMAAFESELRRLRVRRKPLELRTGRDHLRLLIELETAIARHYRFTIADLHAGKKVSIAAEIMANEAQHLAVLRELLGPVNVRRAVPTGFIAGVD